MPGNATTNIPLYFRENFLPVMTKSKFQTDCLQNIENNLQSANKYTNIIGHNYLYVRQCVHIDYKHDSCRLYVDV